MEFKVFIWVITIVLYCKTLAVVTARNLTNIDIRFCAKTFLETCSVKCHYSKQLRLKVLVAISKQRYPHRFTFTPFGSKFGR